MKNLLLSSLLLLPISSFSNCLHIHYNTNFVTDKNPIGLSIQFSGGAGTETKNVFMHRSDKTKDIDYCISSPITRIVGNDGYYNSDNLVVSSSFDIRPPMYSNYIDYCIDVGYMLNKSDIHYFTIFTTIYQKYTAYSTPCSKPDSKENHNGYRKI